MTIIDRIMLSAAYVLLVAVVVALSVQVDQRTTDLERVACGSLEAVVGTVELDLRADLAAADLTAVERERYADELEQIVIEALVLDEPAAALCERDAP